MYSQCFKMIEKLLHRESNDYFVTIERSKTSFHPINKVKSSVRKESWHSLLIASKGSEMLVRVLLSLDKLSGKQSTVLHLSFSNILIKVI